MATHLKPMLSRKRVLSQPSGVIKRTCHRLTEVEDRALQNQDELGQMREWMEDLENKLLTAGSGAQSIDTRHQTMISNILGHMSVEMREKLHGYLHDYQIERDPTKNRMEMPEAKDTVPFLLCLLRALWKHSMRGSHMQMAADYIQQKEKTLDEQQKQGEDQKKMLISSRRLVWRCCHLLATWMGSMRWSCNQLSKADRKRIDGMLSNVVQVTKANKPEDVPREPVNKLATAFKALIAGGIPVVYQPAMKVLLTRLLDEKAVANAIKEDDLHYLLHLKQHAAWRDSDVQKMIVIIGGKDIRTPSINTADVSHEQAWTQALPESVTRHKVLNDLDGEKMSLKEVFHILNEELVSRDEQIEQLKTSPATDGSWANVQQRQLAHKNLELANARAAIEALQNQVQQLMPAAQAYQQSQQQIQKLTKSVSDMSRKIIQVRRDVVKEKAALRFHHLTRLMDVEDKVKDKLRSAGGEYDQPLRQSIDAFMHELSRIRNEGDHHHFSKQEYETLHGLYMKVAACFGGSLRQSQESYGVDDVQKHLLQYSEMMRRLGTTTIR